MIDRSGQGSGEPAIFGFHISPSDAAYLPYLPRAIYVGGDGDVSVLTFGGDVIVFASAAAGSVIPVRATKVFLTGTTATNLVALY